MRLLPYPAWQQILQRHQNCDSGPLQRWLIGLRPFLLAGRLHQKARAQNSRWQSPQVQRHLCGQQFGPVREGGAHHRCRSPQHELSCSSSLSLRPLHSHTPLVHTIRLQLVAYIVQVTLLQCFSAPFPACSTSKEMHMKMLRTGSWGRVCSCRLLLYWSRLYSQD